MRSRAFILWAVTVSLSEAICLAQAIEAGTEEPRAVIFGAAISWAGTKSPSKPVYLFDMGQSAPLRRLLKETNRRLRSIGQGNMGTEGVEIDFYDRVAELVPKLARIAKTRTDIHGGYRFSHLMPRQRYYVVALAVTEDGVSYSAALTSVLKAGEQLRVDLREINLWYVE